jgi:transposase
MDDATVIEESGLRSARMRAREVHGEVLAGPERRRRWSTEEKLRILAQSVAPNSGPALTCRMHGISSGQLYTWRRQFRSGELTGFMPVGIAPDTRELLAAPTPAAAATSPAPEPGRGTIEVELPTGVKLRVTGDVGEAALRRVLSALS